MGYRCRFRPPRRQWRLTSPICRGWLHVRRSFRCQTGWSGTRHRPGTYRTLGRCQPWRLWRRSWTVRIDNSRTTRARCQFIFVNMIRQRREREQKRDKTYPIQSFKKNTKSFPFWRWKIRPSRALRFVFRSRVFQTRSRALFRAIERTNERMRRIQLFCVHRCANHRSFTFVSVSS